MIKWPWKDENARVLAGLAELSADVENLRKELKSMSNTVQTDIANLTGAVTTLTATVAAETAAITSEGSVIAEAVTALQGIASGDSLSPADQAALEAAIQNLGTVNTNLQASTATITNAGSTLAAAIPSTGTVANSGTTSA
jgi:hypothetical protein